MADEQKPATEAPKPAEGAPAADGAAPAEGAEGAAPAAGGKKKILMIAGIAFVVLAILGGAAAFFLLGGEEAPKEDALSPNSAVVVYDLPPFTVNLLSDGGEPHFLKTKLAMELSSEKDKLEVEKLQARVQDDWQNFLRQMRPEDTQGGAAMQAMKEALLLRANQVLAPVVVRNVLFRELLVQ
jgi:flagellar FliL protein